jgi:hypothetical protein
VPGVLVLDVATLKCETEQMIGPTIAAIVVLYLLVSIRILRQYQRGVVFLLGKFTEVRGPGPITDLRPLPGDDPRIFAHRHDANPFTKDYHERQCLNRYRCRRVLPHQRPREGSHRDRECLRRYKSNQSKDGA